MRELRHSYGRALHVFTGGMHWGVLLLAECDVVQGKMGFDETCRVDWGAIEGMEGLTDRGQAVHAWIRIGSDEACEL